MSDDTEHTLPHTEAPVITPSPEPVVQTTETTGTTAPRLETPPPPIIETPTPVNTGTTAPAVGGIGGGGTTGPTLSTPPPGGNYPPPPPPKRGAMSRLFSLPALVVLLLIIIVILFIWGITARTQAPKAPAAPEKVLHVAPPAMPKALNDGQKKDLMSARADFWQHHPSKAIKGYQDLIKQVPDNPELYGELGNIYYTDGQGAQAAHCFEKAAKLLIQAHQDAKAAALLPILGRLDPSAAQSVQALLARSPEASGANPAAAPMGPAGPSSNY